MIDLRKQHDKQSVELNENQNMSSSIADNNPGSNVITHDSPYVYQEMQASQQMPAFLTNVKIEKV